MVLILSDCLIRIMETDFKYLELSRKEFNDFLNIIKPDELSWKSIPIIIK